jgi:two-component system, OmpR family, copper resistance phosphate regulon response regulator CusR
MSILVVEDERRVADLIKRGLETHSYKVDIAFDGMMGRKMAFQTDYDLIILDINLPKINGLDLCTEIRNRDSKVPILFLTAFGTTDDKLNGFDAGADDYIVKPFEIKELLARIKVFLKRSQTGAFQNFIRIADLELNSSSKTVSRGGHPINLTAKEFSLLEYLLQNKGTVVPKAELAEKIWEITFDTGTNIIEVYINYLRKKIDKDFSPKLIHTVIGMGYVIKEGDE